MRGATTLRLVGSLGLAAFIVGGSVQLAAAQSESPSAPPSPSESPAASPPPGIQIPGGPIAWTIGPKVKDFAKAWFFTDVAQALDGTLGMVGLNHGKDGGPAAGAWTSSNAKAWSRVNWEAPDPSSASGIAATPSGFVAVGLGGDVWTSADSTTWTHQIVPDAAFHAVATTATGIVAVGQPAPGAHGVPTIWTSTDATTWQPSTLGSDGTPMKVAVAPDGTVVSVGVAFDPADTKGTTPLPVTWSLSDGVVSQSTLPGLIQAPTAITGLEWTPLGFVASVIQNDSGKQVASVWTSSDGQNWANALDISDGAVSTLGVSGPDIVAFGANRMWQTSDGSNWTELPEPAFKGYYITAVTQLADGRLSAAGTIQTGSTTKAATFIGQPTFLPIGWTIAANGPDFDANAVPTGVTQLADGTDFVVGQVVDSANVATAAAWSSADATTWSRLTLDAPPRSFMSAVAPTAAGPVAVGYTLPEAPGGPAPGLVWAATDPSTWAMTPVPNATYSDITPTGDGFAVLGRENGVISVWTGNDPDPSTWQASTVAEAGIPQFLAISPSGIRVVQGAVFDAAGKASLTTWQSSDGVTWTPVVLPGLASGSTGAGGLAWTPAGFVMSVDEYPKGKPVGSIWVSQDGAAWSRALDVLAGAVGAVGTAGNAAIVFGAASEWRSIDGLSWQVTPAKTFRGYSVRTVTTLPNGDVLAAGPRSTGTTGMATWVGTLATGATN